MSRDDDTEFTLRLGRPRATKGGRARRPLSFQRQVMRAVARAGGDPRRIGRGDGGRAASLPKTGRFNARGRGAKVAATIPRDSGWKFDAETGMRFRARRVIVKARVIKMRGSESQASAAHLRYLQRDGVTRDGERGRLYSSWEEEADGGKTLNIAGDYIPHGIRHRASEIMTLDLGPQSEWELRQSLGQEMEQDRFTRLDSNLLHEAGETGMVDLREGHERSLLGGVNRALLIGRLKKLERMGLATAEEAGRWTLSSGMETTLRDIGEQGDIIKTMHRTLGEQGIGRGLDQYALHRGERLGHPVTGRLVGKGLAGDEWGDRMHLVVDGIDARVHYIEVPGAEADAVKPGSIVEIGPAETAPRPADRNIAVMARDHGGIYRPSEHLAFAHESERVLAGDEEGFVQAHVRRLEALRRAGIVERLDADHWTIPDDFEKRALAYDRQRSRQLAVRVLSAFDLDAQVSTNGATWLDRTLMAGGVASVRDGGFGLEVREALARRQQWLVDQGLAHVEGNMIAAPQRCSPHWRNARWRSSAGRWRRAAPICCPSAKWRTATPCAAPTRARSPWFPANSPWWKTPWNSPWCRGAPSSRSDWARRSPAWSGAPAFPGSSAARAGSASGCSAPARPRSWADPTIWACRPAGRAAEDGRSRTAEGRRLRRARSLTARRGHAQARQAQMVGCGAMPRRFPSLGIWCLLCAYWKLKGRRCEVLTL